MKEQLKPEDCAKLQLLAGRRDIVREPKRCLAQKIRR